MRDRTLREESTEILRAMSEDICDNYCKYRDTAGEDHIWDAIRENGKCPLDVLGV